MHTIDVQVPVDAEARATLVTQLHEVADRLESTLAAVRETLALADAVDGEVVDDEVDAVTNYHDYDTTDYRAEFESQSWSNERRNGC